MNVLAERIKEINHEAHAPEVMKFIPVLVVLILSGFIGSYLLLNHARVTGFAYICRGSQVIQAITEHNDQWITITVNGEDPTSSKVSYKVYQTKRAASCGDVRYPIDVTNIPPRLVLS